MTVTKKTQSELIEKFPTADRQDIAFCRERGPGGEVISYTVTDAANNPPGATEEIVRRYKKFADAKAYYNELRVCLRRKDDWKKELEAAIAARCGGDLWSTEERNAYRAGYWIAVSADSPSMFVVVFPEGDTTSATDFETARQWLRDAIAIEKDPAPEKTTMSLIQSLKSKRTKE